MEGTTKNFPRRPSAPPLPLRSVENNKVPAPKPKKSLLFKAPKRRTGLFFAYFSPPRTSDERP